MAEKDSQIKLTNAQRRGLREFETERWRKAFPSVNPRTAAALWAKHLIEGLCQHGEMTYRLTLEGERVTSELVQNEGRDLDSL